MDNKEIETLAELISIKTSEKYMAITKEYLRQQIDLHAAQCVAKSKMDEFQMHIDDYENNQTTWKDAIKHSTVDVIKLGVVAFLAWLWGKFGK